MTKKQKKAVKQVSALILSLVLFLGLFPASAYGPGSGNGMTPDTAYLISSRQDLLDLSEKVASGNFTYGGRYFKLTCNIDMSKNQDGDKDEISLTPIGADSTHYFAGNFDGQGFTISNLKITTSDRNNVGLFGYIATKGSNDPPKISNLNVTGSITALKGNYVGGIVGYNGCENNTDVILDCSYRGTVSGASYVGGICGGGNMSKISGCTVSARDGVTDTIIGTGSCVGGICGENGNELTHCVNNGVTVNGQTAGGLVGQNKKSGTISLSHNEGSIEPTGQYAAGICGENIGTISQCYNKGTITTKNTARGIAGVTGNNSGAVDSCYNTGAISCINTCGGIVGMNGGAVSNCYNMAEISVNNTGGYIIGDVKNGSGVEGTVSNCYYSESYLLFAGTKTDASMAEVRKVSATQLLTLADKSNDYPDGSTSYPGLNNYDSEEGKYLSDCFSNSYTLNRPVLLRHPEGGIGTSDDPYEIATVGELKNLREQVNRLGLNLSGGAYRLTADLDLTEKDEKGNPISWTSIGTKDSPFAITLDGGGHTITGLYIDGSDPDAGGAQGLFGYIAQGGVVERLQVEGEIKNGTIVGGIVGVNAGTVENCSFTGDVSGDIVGGLVGRNESTAKIKNSYQNGTVTCSETDETCKKGAVVAENSGTVSNCYYNSDKAEDPERISGVSAKNQKEFASGAVAYLLQVSPKNTQVWGQDLGEDEFPQLAVDHATGSTPARVYKVVFQMTVQNETTYIGDPLYANPGDTIPQENIPATAPTPPGYILYKWGLTNTWEATTFTSATPISGDTTVYAVLKSSKTYGGIYTDAVITYGDQKSIELWTLITSSDSETDMKGQFEYTFTRGDDEKLKAEIKDETLIIPSGADAGYYVMYITATKEAKDGEEASSVELLVNLQINKRAQIAPKAPTEDASQRTAGSVTLQTMNANATSGAEVEYRCDSGDWQTSPVFTGLTPDITHTFYARYQEGKNYAASNASEGLSIVLNSDGSTSSPSGPAAVVVPQYSVIASAGSGGSIAPSGTTTVAEGTSQTYIILASNGYEVADVLVDGVSVGAASQYTFANIQSGHTISATFREKVEEPPAPPVSVGPFEDVTSVDWFSTSVAYVYENGLMVGTSESEFSPYMQTSRGMIATILWRMEGEPATDVDALFADVYSEDYYYTAVHWAAEKGIVQGYGYGNYGPSDSISREQLAVMLWRWAGAPEPWLQSLSFTDADSISDYAYKAICWAAESGILRGYDDGSVRPQGLVTRAEVAAMLSRYERLQ